MIELHGSLDDAIALRAGFKPAFFFELSYHSRYCDACCAQGVGLLTGIAGVGGGFAVVPALVLLGRLPMALASGTSLLVIAASSLMALFAHGEWSVEGLRLLFPLLIGGGFGVLLGQRLEPHLPEQRLRQGFAALLLVSAVSSGFEVWQRPDARPVQRSVMNKLPPHR